MRLDDLQLPVALSTIGTGRGAPALVLPGGPCRDPEYLGDLAGLGDERALVVLHPLGTPRSGGVSRGWWNDADDVVAVADALGLESVDLVAHSAGTRLALATAARFPDRVASLALVTPPATWLTGTASDAAALATDRAGQEARAALAALEAAEPRTEQEFGAVMLRSAPAGYARWTAAERAHAATSAPSLAAVAAWSAGIPDDVVDRILARRPARVLVLAGALDLLTGLQPVRDYAALLDAELALLEDCGHYPWVERPAPFRQCLSAWLTAGRH